MEMRGQPDDWALLPPPQAPVQKPIPIQGEGGWVRELLWTFRRKLFAPAGTGTPT